MRIGALKWLAAGLAAMLVQPALAERQAGNARPCPAGLDSVAACYSGQDANGGYYLAAIPKDWNRVLVVHAHGGPRLGQPKADDSDEDLERFQIMVRQGYAWIGSTYRRGGYGVRMAAADVDQSRTIFWQRFGKPRLTILHGQSYGGNVAAKLAELGSVDAAGNRLFDGVMLTNGVLWGGTKAYNFRADLRAVYQYYCRNHPRPEEQQYPAWQGLPRDGKMARRELEARVNACLGLDVAAQKRSADQSRRLQDIVAVTGIKADNIVRHLEWATFQFQDMVQYRLGGRNPFDNRQTVYRNSADDAALNKGVERFAADPQAVAKLAYDSDLTGLIVLPTIAVHWDKDPTVSADADKFYEAKIRSNGLGDYFLGLTSREGTHSKLPDADIMAALDSVVRWAETAQKPTQDQVQTRCKDVARRLNGTCTI